MDGCDDRPRTGCMYVYPCASLSKTYSGRTGMNKLCSAPAVMLLDLDPRGVVKSGGWRCCFYSCMGEDGRGPGLLLWQE
jgi:hypothetical protein